MKYSQKIGCNVNGCTHNSSEDACCTLDKIQVTPCGVKGTKKAEDETACGMYAYSDDKEDKDDIKLTL